MLTKTKRTLPTLFESFMGDLDTIFPDFIASSHMNKGIPAVNLKEDEKSFEIELAAPGMNKKDFNIEVEEDLLTISSDKKEEKEESAENGSYTRREFSFSSFKRSFKLPDAANADKIGAKYEDGILTVNIPKKKEAKKESRRLINVS